MESSVLKIRQECNVIDISGRVTRSAVAGTEAVEIMHITCWL